MNVILRKKSKIQPIENIDSIEVRTQKVLSFIKKHYNNSKLGNYIFLLNDDIFENLYPRDYNFPVVIKTDHELELVPGKFGTIDIRRNTNYYTELTVFNKKYE